MSNVDLSCFKYTPKCSVYCLRERNSPHSLKINALTDISTSIIAATDTALFVDFPKSARALEGVCGVDRTRALN